MNTTTSPSGALRAVAIGAAACGLFDLIFAIVYYHSTAPRILRSIAMGVLGPAAREGGAATAALGFVLHFVIATGIATTYWLASRRLPVLRHSAIVCGLLYGVAVYFVMNWVIVPLSAFPGGNWPPPVAWIPLVVHAVFIGLPVALAVRYVAKPPVLSKG